MLACLDEEQFKAEILLNAGREPPIIPLARSDPKQRAWGNFIMHLRLIMSKYSLASIPPEYGALAPGETVREVRRFPSVQSRVITATRLA
jgi:hypothetical protein